MDAIEEAVKKLNHGLYGPRWCAHCKAVQPVQTFKAIGSDTTEIVGTTVTVGFAGARVCTVCHRNVDNDTLPPSERSK